MNYELRHFDTPLIRFTATEDSSMPQITILWVNEAEKHLLPLDLSLTGDSIAKWLKTQISVFSPPNVSPTQHLDWELGCDPAEPERDVILVGTPWSS